MRAREDLTNVQFPILNSHPKGEAAACVRPMRIQTAVSFSAILSCIGGTFGDPTSTSDEN
ncbi:MAG: hypothetical protein DMG12_10145 [Acidobacteria bacterium]|nr:MAG: hypothetical protein DMG12_10145 [Acidobacteriota bacterium]